MKRYLHAALIFVSLMLILNSLVWLRSNNLYKAHLNLHMVTFESTYKGIINTFQLVSQTIAEEILQKEDVTQLIHRIISTRGDERNHVRGLLYRKLSPIYERISQHSIHQIHFHFPDNRSMLRFMPRTEPTMIWPPFVHRWLLPTKSDAKFTVMKVASLPTASVMSIPSPIKEWR